MQIVNDMSPNFFYNILYRIALGTEVAKPFGGPLVNSARPSERENRRVMRRFYTATARPRPAGETP